MSHVRGLNAMLVIGSSIREVLFPESAYNVDSVKEHTCTALGIYYTQRVPHASCTLQDIWQMLPKQVPINSAQTSDLRGQEMIPPGLHVLFLELRNCPAADDSQCMLNYPKKADGIMPNPCSSQDVTQRARLPSAEVVSKAALNGCTGYQSHLVNLCALEDCTLCIRSMPRNPMSVSPARQANMTKRTPDPACSHHPILIPHACPSEVQYALGLPGRTTRWIGSPILRTASYYS